MTFFLQGKQAQDALILTEFEDEIKNSQKLVLKRIQYCTEFMAFITALSLKSHKNKLKLKAD